MLCDIGNVSKIFMLQIVGWLDGQNKKPGQFPIPPS